MTSGEQHLLREFLKATKALQEARHRLTGITDETDRIVSSGGCNLDSVLVSIENDGWEDEDGVKNYKVFKVRIVLEDTRDISFMKK